MKTDNKFQISKFLSPDVSRAPVYNWVWNDVCTRERIDAQLDEMQALGIRAFCIIPEPREFRPDSMPTKLEPDYLSPEYFALCAYAIEKGGLRGMRCWIYDEGGWPSGGACGKVLQDHPECARQVLQAKERTVLAGDRYQRSSPEVLAAFWQDKEMIADGYRFETDGTVTEYTISQEIFGSADFPDLLSEDATRYFIEITHQGYAAAMPSALGQTVTALFTDEPKAPAKAFRRELAEQYEARYGESILPYLPLLAGRAEPTAETVPILQRWYDLCSRMLCEHYLLPCKRWANEHGLAFTGHMDVDHSPLGCIRGGANFHLMRALRCMDLPGIDVIWRQIYPEDRVSDRDELNAYNGFFPRYAASAAAQNGTNRAMAEIFGVAGPGLTYDIMRYTVGYLAVRGVSVFNIFNFPLGRKDALLAQELPVFTQNQIYHRYFRQFNPYMERLSYISSIGKRICETGLYYPIRNFVGGTQADAAAAAFDILGRALEEQIVDFDIVDDDVLQAATGADSGCLRIGSAVYRHIILPENADLPPETKEILQRFTAAGGKVSHKLCGLRPVLPVEGSGLRAMHRRAENGEIFCLFREGGKDGTYRIHLPAESGYLLDLAGGAPQRFRAENGILELTLAVGETAVILLGSDAFAAEANPEFSRSIPLSGEFCFRKELSLTADENGWKTVAHADRAVSVCLGDWAGTVGEAYSGSCIYEKTFSLPTGLQGKAGAIDLGDVRFAAEVSLNGISLGSVLAPPYRLRIPAGLLAAENHLEIRVTNTPANWYVHTDYFDQWTASELSPYFAGELEYAKDSVSGGLYGPVTLYTNE